eukprot:CAMPEP_0170137140 /NCGR_PEP_ID=MMETSP0033_2-20121228/3912_1 /TAXON_ID=195969 /ORGANISM="Dolichomastix tenuilepis, Strain CCMP3274" /LENGTH=98 /DNA_ID=CAMNT_0010372971 /DNA_START=83 /DNA_END=379 /DNA_ORIENTATION=+
MATAVESANEQPAFMKNFVAIEGEELKSTDGMVNVSKGDTKLEQLAEKERLKQAKKADKAAAKEAKLAQRKEKEAIARGDTGSKLSKKERKKLEAEGF